METYKLKRSEMAPLKFDGELIAEASSRDHNSNRWTEIRVYRTNGGNFVWESQYRTLWSGEHDNLSASHYPGWFDMLSGVIDGRDRIAEVECEALDKAAKSIGMEWAEVVK